MTFFELRQSDVLSGSWRFITQIGPRRTCAMVYSRQMKTTVANWFQHLSFRLKMNSKFSWSSFKIITAWWRHMTTLILVDIGSGYGPGFMACCLTAQPQSWPHVVYSSPEASQWAQYVIKTSFCRHIKVVTSSNWNTTSKWRLFYDVFQTVMIRRQCDVVLWSVMVATFSQLFHTLFWRLRHNV